MPHVTLQPVTAGTVRAVTALRVAPEQKGYVASNAVSIAEAYFHPEAWFRAVCVDQELVGFVMLRDWSLAAAGGPIRREISLWRFMIDRRCQGRGYGKHALSLVIAHARERFASELHTSYVDGPRSPSGFYRAFGFGPSGFVKSNGEIGLVLHLNDV